MDLNQAYNLTKDNCLAINGNFAPKKFNILRKSNLEYDEFIRDCYGSLNPPTNYWHLMRLGHSSPLICQAGGCNNITKWDRGRSCFAESCSYKCAGLNKNRVDKMKKTWTERYGGFGFASKSHTKKACATMREKYGSDFYVETEEFEEKRLSSMRTRYGVDYPMQYKAGMDAHRKVMIDRYGVPNGLEKNSPLKTKAIKTTIDRYGNEQIMATKYIRALKEKQGEWTPLHKVEDFHLYKRMVVKFTNKTLRTGNFDLSKRGRLAQRADAQHVDHRLSIKEAFDNNIPPYIVGSTFNLTMLGASENCSKRHKSTLAPNDLIDMFFASLREHPKR